MNRKYPQNNKFINWLKSKSDSGKIYNNYSPDSYTLYYNNTNDLDLYLNKIEDIERIEQTKIYNPNDMSENDKILEKYIERYKNGKKILINPDTIHYHIHTLYQKLIDHKDNTNYLLQSIEIDGSIDKNMDENVNIFDKSIKDAFYRFCFENSI